MDKKARLGKDPFLGELIKDTRKEGGKQILPSKQGKQLKKKAGRPRTNLREITKTSQAGTQEGWTRATFIVREDTLDKLKKLAYWDRKQIKEVIDEAFSSYLKGKNIKPISKGDK